MSDSNEYVLVTGASSGIGRQIAINLSQSKNIVLCARNTEGLKETKSLCNVNSNILIWEFDISKIDEIEVSLGEFIKNNGIHVSDYVHSAGVDGMRPLRSLDYNFVLNVYNVNVFSFMFIVKLLCNKKVNGLKPHSIVMISSNIAEMGAKAFSAYNGSKAAANGLVRSLAMELAPDVRVNSISPGAIQTNMTEQMQIDGSVVERMKNTYPLGWGKTEYIANAVKFLLSDESQWITGQNLIVDGGRTINLNG